MGPPHPGGMGPHDLGRMEQADPEMAALARKDMELERACFELAERYRRAPKGEEKDKIRAEIEAKVTEHFILRQERRELELSRLREQLERLAQALKKREDSRDEIIGQRVGQLLGDSDYAF
jgi:hypothetical protein